MTTGDKAPPSMEAAHEDTLRELEERYRTIFSEARDGIVLIDADTGFVADCNPEFERQCDRPLAQLRGLRIWELRPPELREAARAKFEEVRATGSGGSAELALQRPDGTRVPVEFVSTRVRLGGREYLQSICRDITERKRTEREMSRTRELLERMFETIHILAAYMDRYFNFIRVNRAYAAADGRTPEFFPGKNHFALYPNAENETIFRRVVETGEPYVAIEKAFVYAEHPERGVTYWDWRVEPVKDAGGRVEGVLLSLLDATERVRARQALTESEEKFHRISASAQDAIIMLDDEGRIVYWNPAAERIFGYCAEEVAGKAMHRLLVPSRYHAAYEKGFAAFRISGEGSMVGKTLELAALRKDGAELPVELSVSALKLKGRWHALGILRDITERKRAEEALRESERAYRTLAENLPGIVYRVFAREGNRMEFYNKAAEQVTGYTPDELRAGEVCMIEPLILEEDRPDVVAEVKRAVTQDRPFTVEYRLRHKDGGIRYLLEQGRPVRGTDGKPLYIDGVIFDVTQRKQAEKALHRANRALKALSACNAALIHAENEHELLDWMCRIVVEEGGYRLTWVGFVEHDEEKSVRPVAHAGFEAGYLETLQITWADTERGRGPTGLAIRTGQPQAARHIQTDPHFAPWRAQALKRGYASSLALPLKEEDGEVFAVLNIYAAEPDAFDREEIKLLQELADDLAYGILTLRTRTERDRLQEEHLKSGERLKAALTDTIRVIALTVEKRDPYTAGHQQRVSELCVAIGQELGLDPGRLEGLRLGALIHDIGKVYIPAEILNRPGKLTDAEFEIIKSHPDVGYEIVKDVKFPWPVAPMILQHHERLDGSGYPKGLKGEAFILEARILAVADVVEAMASHRPYRPAHGIEAALKEIERHRGDWYDPVIADACLKLFREKGFRFSPGGEEKR